MNNERLMDGEDTITSSVDDHGGFADAGVACLYCLHDQEEQHPLLLTAETSSFTLIVCPLGRAVGSSPTSRAFLLTT